MDIHGWWVISNHTPHGAFARRFSPQFVILRWSFVAGLIKGVRLVSESYSFREQLERDLAGA